MVELTIKKIMALYGEERFTAGDCHHLAAALYHLSQDAGSFYACLRNDVAVDHHARFSTTYSHMVYASVDGASWDIQGKEADVNWESQWDTEFTDEDGLRNELVWVHLTYENLAPWLKSHGSVFNPVFVDEIVEKIKRQPTATLRIQHG